MSKWICKKCDPPCKLDTGEDNSEPDVCPFRYDTPDWRADNQQPEQNNQ